MRSILCTLGVALALAAPAGVPVFATAVSAGASVIQGGTMNDAALRAALKRIGSGNQTLVVPSGSWNIGHSVDIPANVHLKLEYGAAFNIQKGQTLNIAGSFEALGLNPIFSGAGTVHFGGGYLGEVYPQWWGKIKGENDTAACQAALDSGAATIRFPKGVYAVDAVGEGKDGGLGLFPASDTKLLFDAGAVLQAITTDKNDYTILNISGKTNVTVDGATIRGERKTHTGKGGEWGHGLRIVQHSKNIVIKNVDVADCWGDGIYLGENCVDGVLVQNSKFDNCRRNACSITDAKNVLFKKCSFTNSNATSPFKGVDVEPNKASDIIENIVFEGCDSSGNLSGGFSLARDDKQDTPVSVTFRDCISRGDGGGFSIDIGPSDCAGFMNIVNCTVVNPGETGFRCTSANLQINIDGLYIVNPNQKGEYRPQFTSGLSFWNAAKQYQGKRKIMGNISAKNVFVYADDGKAGYALYTNNELGEDSGFQNIDVQLKTNLPANKRFYKGVGPYYNYCNVDFPDAPTVHATENVAAADMAAYVNQTITNAGAAKDITLSLTDPRASTLGSVYTIEAAADHKINVDLGDVALLPGSIKKFSSATPGSRLKIKSNGKNWLVVEQVGAWVF